MSKKDVVKLILFVALIGSISYALFYLANQKYISVDSEKPVTNIYIVNAKDTIVLHDTLINVKWRTKKVKVCCCNHDSIKNVCCK